MTIVGQRPCTRGITGLVFMALLMTACFDSRWGEAKRAQEAAATRETPGALRATPRVSGSGPAGTPQNQALRVLKMRVHATPRHAAEVMDWRRRIAAQVDDANQVLGPTFDVRLEIASAEPWAPRGGDDDLATLTEELATFDPGTDVDWVVALAGSVPRLEVSFHQLGMGNVLGKHLVVRAMNDAREYDALQRELSDLDETERLKVYRARRRHKSAAVLLHEIGHTLGAPHEIDTTTLMHARYDAKVGGFSPAAAELMHINLVHRLEPQAETEQGFAQRMFEQLEATSAAWVPEERDELAARLKRAMAALPRPRPASRPVREQPPIVPEEQAVSLTAADRVTFERARADRQSGSVREAWDEAKPLFAAYPDVYAVQDLRCQLAMQIGLTLDLVNTECDRLMRLTPGVSDDWKRHRRDTKR